MAQITHEHVSIIIDASNVCWGAAFSDLDPDVAKRKRPIRARPPLRGLVLVVNFFEPYRLRGATVLAVAPGWWGRLTHMATDDQIAFDQLREAGVLVLAPEGIHDDYVILGCAFREGRIGIVTNDLFRDHQSNLGLDAKWYYDRRIGFKFMDDDFQPDRNQLEKVFGLDYLSSSPRPADDDATHISVDSTFTIPAKWGIATEAHELDEHAIVIESEPGVPAYDCEVKVDASLLGLMIGKGGERIKRIELKYGTNIRIQGDIVKLTSLSLERLFWAKVEFCNVETYGARTHFAVPTTTSFSEAMELVEDDDNNSGNAALASIDPIKKPLEGSSQPTASTTKTTLPMQKQTKNTSFIGDSTNSSSSRLPCESDYQHYIMDQVPTNIAAVDRVKPPKSIVVKARLADLPRGPVSHLNQLQPSSWANLAPLDQPRSSNNATEQLRPTEKRWTSALQQLARDEETKLEKAHESGSRYNDRYNGGRNVSITQQPNLAPLDKIKKPA